jgi:putative NADPH-quinone reductase
MKISVILAHPYNGSFNYAIADAAFETLNKNGHIVFYHDLYREEFDPVLPFEEIHKGACLPSGIEKHCKEILQSQGIIIVHLNWCGQPPLILKGWVDRVVRLGVSYELREGDKGEGVPIGLLKAKSALFGFVLQGS